MRHFFILATTLIALTSSTLSSEAETIGNIKSNHTDGEAVEICGVVSAVFSDCVYIEDGSRCSGIKLTGFPGDEGIEYDMTVKMSTDSIGERTAKYVPGLVCSIFTGNIAPLYMQNKSIGGKNFDYNQFNHTGQLGTYNGVGLNNIGLLVKTSGNIACINYSEKYIYVDDGSRKNNDIDNNGIRVSYKDIPNFTPRLGVCASVTGISSLFSIGDKIQPMIRCRSVNDIQY